MASCKKTFLDAKPDGTIVDAQIKEASDRYSKSAFNLANASIAGIYYFMHSFNTAGRASGRHDDFGQKSIDLSTDLMTEDMVQAAHHHFGFDYLLQNNKQAFARTFTNWNFYYKVIFNANRILAPIDPNTADINVRGLRGQALALRAFSYLNLIQLYQQTYKGNENAKGVPIYTIFSSDINELNGKSRGTVTAVYQQIEKDLLAAIPALQGYQRMSKEQIDQHVAEGILARAYLNMENWTKAADYAHQARQGLSLMSQTDYQDGFYNISNTEWMWGGDISGVPDFVASFFGHIDNLDVNGYAGGLGIYKLISKKLFDQIPVTDVRRSVFNDPVTPQYPDIDAYAQVKFVDKTGTNLGDYIYMRTAEMYLIEAEALAMNGNLGQAAQVLFDLVKQRDPAYVMPPANGTLINEIRKQRRIELWGEGFSLNDFKRWKLGIDRTGSNHRPDAIFQYPAGDNLFIYQIPQAELDANPKIPISDQNP